MLKISFGAALVLTGVTIAVGASGTPLPPGGIVLVAGGCGFGFHPNLFGGCVPNRRFVYGAPVIRLPPPCPRFYHRDPDPARPICYPNL